MNKTPEELIIKIKELLDDILCDSYDLDVIKEVYDYPATLIPNFPAITLEFVTRTGEDETLGDERYLETYTVTIKGYVLLLDSRDNYLQLLRLDTAIKEMINENRVVTGYWRNSTNCNSDYSTATLGEALCRQTTLTWMFEHMTIPS